MCELILSTASGTDDIGNQVLVRLTRCARLFDKATLPQCIERLTGIENLLKYLLINLIR